MELLRLCRVPAITAKPEITVFQAAVRMAECRIGAIVIVNDENRPLGIFTERDHLFRVTCQELDPKATQLASVMSSPVTSAPADMKVDDALARMIRQRLRHLPVTDMDGCVIGMASLQHLLMHRIGEEHANLETLSAYVCAGGPG